METQVDARGMACPQPVICAKAALENLEQGTLDVLVDNDVALQNVIKLAKTMLCSHEVNQQEDAYRIRITKGQLPFPLETLPGTSAMVVLITRGTLGSGDDELGRILMKSFLYTLGAGDPAPQAIMLLNGGVKLAVEGSELLECLLVLQQKGTEILCCGTCLDFFNLKSKLAIGAISNMYDILDKVNRAQKCVTI